MHHVQHRNYCKTLPTHNGCRKIIFGIKNQRAITKTYKNSNSCRIDVCYFLVRYLSIGRHCDNSNGDGDDNDDD